MEKIDNNIGATLGEIGCRFKSNIGSHIKDYDPQKDDDVEWLLEPLDAISHQDDIVLDLFKVETNWESFHGLYFHNKNAKHVYIPFDKLPKRANLFKNAENASVYPRLDEIERSRIAKPYDKTMQIKGSIGADTAEQIPPIWDDLIIQFTEQGVWQAILLNEAITLCPKGWCCSSIKRSFIFTKSDMEQLIEECRTIYGDSPDAKNPEASFTLLGHSHGNDDSSEYTTKDFEQVLSYLGQVDFAPTVEINGDKAVATYCYWSIMTGFCRDYITVERHNQSVVLGYPRTEVLANYDRGLLF